MTARRRPTIVEVETSFQLISPNGATIPIDVSLFYDRIDPFAVDFLFFPEDVDEPVSWWFARELLETGIKEPAGIGQVSVYPWPVPYGEFTALVLSTPDGNALYKIPRSIFVRFLRRTYRVVPRGRESEHLDVDTVAGRLLAGQ